MKLINLSKTIRIGLVATALSTLPLILPVSAQDTQNTPTTPDTTAPNTTAPDTTAPTTTDRTNDVYTDNTDDNNKDFDWGWLGLLGLAGLLGLRRKHDDVAYRRDVNIDPTTTTRTDHYK